jgi:predicted PurR-regulated permease PerM
MTHANATSAKSAASALRFISLDLRLKGAEAFVTEAPEMEPEPHDPWSWVTEPRVTHVLKILMVAVLAVYLGTFVFAFLDRIHTVVLLIVGAIFFAYLIYPLVRYLHRRMHMIYAIVVVYVAIFAIVAAAGAFLVPRVSDDVSQLIAHYPDIGNQVTSYVNDPHNPLLARLPEGVRAEVIRVPERIADWFRVNGVQALQHALSFIVGTFASVASFIIIPLITAYMLLDLDRLKGSLARIVPASRRQGTLGFLSEVDRIVGGYIRGQIIVAILVGVLLTIALLLLHVRYAFLLGIAAAIGDLIPYIGAIVVFIPAVLVALINNGWANALLVVVAFVLIYEVEGHVLGPTIMSTQVKLSPLIVLVAILVGAELGGLIGMLVAVPVAGVLRAIVIRVTGTREPVADKAPAPANQKAP